MTIQYLFTTSCALGPYVHPCYRNVFTIGFLEEKKISLNINLLLVEMIVIIFIYTFRHNEKNIFHCYICYFQNSYLTCPKAH